MGDENSELHPLGSIRGRVQCIIPLSTFVQSEPIWTFRLGNVNLFNVDISDNIISVRHFSFRYFLKLRFIPEPITDRE